jgi:hypothetical protein
MVEVPAGTSRTYRRRWLWPVLIAVTAVVLAVIGISAASGAMFPLAVGCFYLAALLPTFWTAGWYAVRSATFDAEGVQAVTCGGRRVHLAWIEVRVIERWEWTGRYPTEYLSLVPADRGHRLTFSSHGEGFEDLVEVLDATVSAATRKAPRSWSRAFVAA